MRKSVALLLSLSALSACGPGSDDSLFLPGPEGLNALIIESEALFDKSDSLEPSTSVPGGSVEYNGVMSLLDVESDANEGYIGDVVVDASFATNALTATGTDFFFQSGEAPGEARDGELVFTSADVGLGAVALFSGTLTGDLDLGSGPEALIGAGIGMFTGDDADMVEVFGGVNGTDLEFIIIAD